MSITAQPDSDTRHTKTPTAGSYVYVGIVYAVDAL